MDTSPATPPPPTKTAPPADKAALQTLLAEPDAVAWYRRPLWWGVAVAVLLAVGGVWYWQSQKAANAAPTYTTQPVALGNLTLTVTANGTLQPTRAITIGSELSGIVRQVNVDVNDRIKKGQVLVVGVDRMLTALARCCKPAPPDVIKGFVTRGRGVSVHRDNCATFMRMAQDAPERVIDTEWGQSSAIEPARYLMDMVLVARSRPDLLRDVAEVLAREKIPMAKLNSFPKGDTITMVMTLQVIDGAQLERALVLLNDMPGAISARRG
jgi:(p)ppGpp synthase/HD superfamily hydrolase